MYDKEIDVLVVAGRKLIRRRFKNASCHEVVNGNLLIHYAGGQTVINAKYLISYSVRRL